MVVTADEGGEVILGAGHDCVVGGGSCVGEGGPRSETARKQLWYLLSIDARRRKEGRGR